MDYFQNTYTYWLLLLLLLDLEKLAIHPSLFWHFKQQRITFTNKYFLTLNLQLTVAHSSYKKLVVDIWKIFTSAT